MITLEELRNLSGDRLEDAKALYKAKRYDWAAYTCGYAVEPFSEKFGFVIKKAYTLRCQKT